MKNKKNEHTQKIEKLMIYNKMQKSNIINITTKTPKNDRIEDKENS